MAFSTPRAHLPHILPLLLVFSFSPFLFSHVAAKLHQSSSSGRWEFGMLPWRRLMSEEISGANFYARLSTDNSTFILARERTLRPDPMNGYNYYTGGWNITDQHYMASVASTAFPLLSIAIAWLFGFGLVLLLGCCCVCCCRRRRSHTYSHACHALSLILLIVLVCATIIGSIILYNGQEKFHHSTLAMLDYVKEQSDFVVGNLQNYANKMSGAKKIGVDQVFLPADLQEKIDSIITKLNASVDELSSRTTKNFKQADNMLNIAHLNLIMLATVMLLLAILGFLFSILGMQFIVYFLVVISWILIAGTLILGGMVFLLHNVVGDTCVAMDEWAANPHAYTALGEILPCLDAATANESLTRSKEVTFQLINVVNGVILNVTNVNFQPGTVPPPLNYNQSGPLMPALCNPYMPDLREGKCRPGEVSFDDASEVWKRFICKTKVVSGNEICTSVGRITLSVYNDMIGATSMSQGLHLYTPFLIKVADCTIARETFSSISSANCPGLERYSYETCIGLIIMSAPLMLSLIIWMVLTKQRRQRKFSKKFITQEGPLIAGHKL